MIVQKEMNKLEDAYLVSVSPWLPTIDLAESEYSTISLNIQPEESARVATEISEIEGACINSGSKFDINPNTSEVEVELTMGPGLFLEGAVPGAVEVQRATCHFPTINAHGNPIVLEMQGCGIYYKDATSKIISLDNLLKAKCKYCRTITLPDGNVIVMIYAKGTWCLPTLTRLKAADLHHDRYIATVNCMKEKVSDSNQYKELLDLAAEA
eukprot:2724282-Rhodomonas_salina.1